MTLKSSHLVAQWVQEKGTQPSQRSREKADLERANEQLQQLGDRFVRLYLQTVHDGRSEYLSWFQHPRYLRQDLLSSDDERKRLKLTLQNQEQDVRRTIAVSAMGWTPLPTDQLRASKKGSPKKWKNEPQWFRNLLNESFLSIFVLVEGVCCFNQSRFLSLKSNTFPFVKSSICLAPTVKGIAGATPASGRSEAGPALWSFISTNYLFKAIGKPWLGRLMR